MNNKHIGIHNSVFRVGIVYSVNGREVKIRVDHNKNSSHLIYKGALIKNVSVGSYVKILKGYTPIIGKVESEYIKSLIKKITDKSEMNVFYHSYQNNCVRCVNKDKCPIKSNYELLSEDKCQDAICLLYTF